MCHCQCYSLLQGCQHLPSPERQKCAHHVKPRNRIPVSPKSSKSTSSIRVGSKFYLDIFPFLQAPITHVSTYPQKPGPGDKNLLRKVFKKPKTNPAHSHPTPTAPIVNVVPFTISCRKDIEISFL